MPSKLVLSRQAAAQITTGTITTGGGNVTVASTGNVTTGTINTVGGGNVTITSTNGLASLGPITAGYNLTGTGQAAGNVIVNAGSAKRSTDRFQLIGDTAVPVVAKWCASDRQAVLAASLR